MDHTHREALDLLESAIRAQVNVRLVDQEIVETLEDCGSRIRALSANDWGCLRESVLKIASLIYMTYSLADPNDFARILQHCAPAAVCSTANQFQSLAWVLEHRMLRCSRWRLRPGNLLHFNLNQSRLFAWHARPPIALHGVVALYPKGAPSDEDEDG